MVQIGSDEVCRKVHECRNLEKGSSVVVGRKGGMCTFVNMVYCLPCGGGG